MKKTLVDNLKQFLPPIKPVCKEITDIEKQALDNLLAYNPHVNLLATLKRNEICSWKDGNESNDDLHNQIKKVFKSNEINPNNDSLVKSNKVNVLVQVDSGESKFNFFKFKIPPIGKHSNNQSQNLLRFVKVNEALETIEKINFKHKKLKLESKKMYGEMKSILYNNQFLKNKKYFYISKTRLKKINSINNLTLLFNQKIRSSSLLSTEFQDKNDRKESKVKFDLESLVNENKTDHARNYCLHNQNNYPKILLQKLLNEKINNNRKMKRVFESFETTNTKNLKPLQKSIISVEEKNAECGELNLTIKNIMNKIKEIKHRKNKKFR